MPFSSVGLSDPLASAASQYASPTPVQTAAIPVVLAGGDVLTTAPTGSGKTTAYVLPILQRWLEAHRERKRPVHSLILVPTRELAAQVRDVIQQCAPHLPERIKVVSAVGGVSINPQMMAFRGGADFVVATDLAARGIDIVQLPVVLNYDLPRSPDDYTHRIGRTGRAGEPGLAISLVTAEAHAHFRLIEKRHDLKIPRLEIAGFEPKEAPLPPSAGSGGIKGHRKSKKDKLREAKLRGG